MLKNERNLKSNRTDYDLVFPSTNKVTRRKVLHTFKRQEEAAWKRDLAIEEASDHFLANSYCVKCGVHELHIKNYGVICYKDYEWTDYDA